MKKLKVNYLMLLKYSLPFFFLFSFFVYSQEQSSSKMNLTLGDVFLPKKNSTQTNVLTLNQAIAIAQKNDPQWHQNKLKQQALISKSLTIERLPDPKISLGFFNLPSDNFSRSQEGMTQTKITLTQHFSRGNSLSLKSEHIRIKTKALFFQQKDREAKIRLMVGQLWFERYRINESIALIHKNRVLFEQLLKAAHIRYTSATEKTRQQDMIRAELELTRFDDRLEQLMQKKAHNDALLFSWLIPFNADSRFYSPNQKQHLWPLKPKQIVLPHLKLKYPALIHSKLTLQTNVLFRYFKEHPALQVIQENIKASHKNIELTKEQYQPLWGINASYGYRAHDTMGRSRSDLFSIGLRVDWPLWSKTVQNKDIQSEIFKTEAVKMKKAQLLKQLVGEFLSAKGRLLHINSRLKRYQTQWMDQIQSQSEASLTAYTNDYGDFSEVVRDRIAALNAQMNQLTLTVEEKKIHLTLNYLLTGYSSS
jgi:hypothetical protein